MNHDESLIIVFKHLRHQAIHPRSARRQECSQRRGPRRVDCSSSLAAAGAAGAAGPLGRCDGSPNQCGLPKIATLWLDGARKTDLQLGGNTWNKYLMGTLSIERFFIAMVDLLEAAQTAKRLQTMKFD